MARKKPGHTVVSVEMPDELLAIVRETAERGGLKVSTWVVSLAAKKVGFEFAPPPLGRPTIVDGGEEKPKKSAAKKGKK